MLVSFTVLLRDIVHFFAFNFNFFLKSALQIFFKELHNFQTITSLKIALAPGTEMPYLSLQKIVGTVIFVMFVSGGEERITPSLVWK